MPYNENNIKHKYCHYIKGVVSDNILIRIIIGYVLLSLVIGSDLFFIDNIYSFYIRLPLLVINTILLFFYIFLRKNTSLLFSTYTLLLTLIPISLYAKIYLHFNDEQRFISSTIGSLTAIFMLSIELKTKKYLSAILFFVPFFTFMIIGFVYFNDFDKLHFVFINIFPIIIFGFITNLLLNNQSYKIFKSNYLLNIEKDKVKELNEQNLKVIDELEKTNATKNKFFSIIAHDLKSPFNIIGGYSELLAEEYDKYNDEKRKQFIKEIHTASNNTLNLVENLLTWARSQQGHIKIKKEKINLLHFFKNEINQCYNFAKTKQISININIKEICTLYADKFTFNIIVTNIINNAIKFTNPKGEINIGTEKANTYIVITISDNGIGMSKEKQESLFNIDKNNSTRGTNNEKGTGLGLILCKEFTEKNGGYIAVESTKGKGTKFSLFFPS